MTAPAPVSRRALRWGAVASAGLMFAGVGAFAYASQVAARRAPGADAVTVTLRGDACQPNALTVRPAASASGSSTRPSAPWNGRSSTA